MCIHVAGTGLEAAQRRMEVGNRIRMGAETAEREVLGAGSRGKICST